MARFARTLGTLLGNGVPLLPAVTMVREILRNRVVHTAMSRVAEQLERGHGLSQPMTQAGVFPPLALELIAVGEQSGHLQEMLLEISTLYDRQVEETTSRLLNLLEPILILFMGALVGGIILSILLAVLSLNDMVF